MAKMDVIEFGAFVRSKVTKAQDVQSSTSIVLGIAVSRMLPMPTGDLGALDMYYNTNSVFEADRLIGEFNESLVIDIELARQVARGFWKMRALAAASSTSNVLYPRGPESFFEKFFGVSSYLPKGVSDFLNANSEVMCVLLNRIQPLLVTALPAQA